MIRLLRNFSVVFVISSFCLNGMEEKKYTNIWEAIDNHDSAAVEQFLSEGADPNEVLGTEIQYTPLLWAVYNSNPKAQQIKTIESLLKHNADSNKPNQDQVTPLMLAARQGNIGQVEMLLANKANVNAKDKFGDTPLHHAAHGLDDESVKLLLKNGATVNAQNIKGTTPLHTAIQRGICNANLIAIVNHELGNGADPNIPDNQGMTPLHHAIEINCLDIIQPLLDKGANVNAQDNKGKTALIHYLERESHWDSNIFKSLFNAHADINLADKQGTTPLHLAIKKRIPDIVKTLINQGANVNAQDENKDTPLHIAARDGDADFVKLLLDNGVNILQTNKRGDTALAAVDTILKAQPTKAQALQPIVALLQNAEKPGGIPSGQLGAKAALLIDAVKQLDVARVQQLLSEGADPNVQDEHGNTPLNYAAVGKNAIIAQDLLNNKANPNIPNIFGETPLHVAIYYGEFSIAELLIHYGANVQAQDYNGNTPLHYASQAHANAVPMVELLLAAHADPNITTNLNRTALHTAAHNTSKLNDQAKLISLLIEAGADPSIRTSGGDTALQKYENPPESFFKPDEKIIKLFTIQCHGDTPLHYAVRGNHEHTVKKLLESSTTITSVRLRSLFNLADVNAKNEYGKTPLHEAVKKGNIRIVADLLDSKANPNIPDNDGLTPLHEAAMQGAYGIATLLINKHADLNAQDKFGETPLNYAVSHGHPMVVDLLLHHGADSSVKNKKGRTVFDIIQSKLRTENVPASKYQDFNNILALLEISPIKEMPVAEPSYKPPFQPEEAAIEPAAEPEIPAEVPVPTGEQAAAAAEALQQAPVPRSKAKLLKQALIAVGVLATTYGLYYYLTPQTVPTNLTPTELETQIVTALHNKNYDYANKLADSNPQAVAGLSPQQRQELEQVIDTTIIQASREAAKTAGTYNLLGYFQPPLPEQLRLLHNLTHTIERG